MLIGLTAFNAGADPSNNGVIKPTPVAGLTSSGEGDTTGKDGKATTPLALAGYGLTALIGFFAWMENREKRKAVEARNQAESEVQTTKQKATKLEEEKKQLTVRAKELEGRLLYVRKGITEPVQLPTNEFRNLMMIIGLGGSGKTSLIRMIFNDRGANPQVKTDGQQLFRTHFGFNAGELNGDLPRTLHVFACDYVGQNLSTLTRTFVKQQQDLYSPMAYGYINAIVLVVDLREPPEVDGGTVPVTDEPNQQRINEHLTEWNDTALAALAGFVVADTLKFVCLYINKIDLLNKSSVQDRMRYKALFEILRIRLVERFAPARVTVIVGSALYGDGYNELRQGLVDSAMRVSNESNGEHLAEVQT